MKICKNAFIVWYFNSYGSVVFVLVFRKSFMRQVTFGTASNSEKAIYMRSFPHMKSLDGRILKVEERNNLIWLELQSC